MVHLCYFKIRAFKLGCFSFPPIQKKRGVYQVIPVTHLKAVQFTAALFCLDNGSSVGAYGCNCEGNLRVSPSPLSYTNIPFSSKWLVSDSGLLTTSDKPCTAPWITQPSLSQLTESHSEMKIKQSEVLQTVIPLVLLLLEYGLLWEGRFESRSKKHTYKICNKQ